MKLACVDYCKEKKQGQVICRQAPYLPSVKAVHEHKSNIKREVSVVRERSNIINTVQKHVERVLAKDWASGIADYRYRASREWNLGYIMEVLMAGALMGCKTLREIETVSEVYADRVPDTTLHDMMIRINPESLRAELAKGVKQALRAHELPKEEFPVRITAIDGKYNYNTAIAVNEFSEPIGGGGNDEQFRHMALRAMYVSGETKLFLGQHEIVSKNSETKGLIPFVHELLNNYGNTGLLEVVSVDAGMVSKSNAAQLIQLGLDYIMALKGSQPKLFALVEEIFKDRAPDCVAEEIQNGKQFTRKLYRTPAPAIESWAHGKELWKIETSSVDKNGRSGKTEVRYYITSLVPATLTNSQVLHAIRMHWGIENNANWCFDMLWNEDTAPWTSRAMVLVAHLRMMAYNIIQRLKTRKLKAARNRALGWKDLFYFFNHALSRSRQEAEATGQAVPAFL